MMNRPAQQRTASRHALRSPLALDAIEWEELPSLAEALDRSESFFTGAAVWTATQRMDLHAFDEVPAPAPFEEPVHGLQVREIEGREVFRHFFGARAER